MYDSHLMQIFKCTDKWCKDVPKLLFRKRFFLDSSLFDNLDRMNCTLDMSPLAAYYMTM